MTQPAMQVGKIGQHSTMFGPLQENRYKVRSLQDQVLDMASVQELGVGGVAFRV